MAEWREPYRQKENKWPTEEIKYVVSQPNKRSGEITGNVEGS